MSNVAKLVYLICSNSESREKDKSGVTIGITPGRPRTIDRVCFDYDFSYWSSSVTERRVSDSGPVSRDLSKEHSVRSGRLSSSSIGGSQPLNRLARLLNQRPSFTPSDEIPRRLSWERYVTEWTERFSQQYDVFSLCENQVIRHSSQSATWPNVARSQERIQKERNNFIF